MESAWWEDESELLDAALTMLAEWEGAPLKPHSLLTREADESPSAETETSSGDGQVPEKPRRRVKVNISRERQKKEKQELRRLATELERELVSLQLRSAKRQRSRDGGSMWENMTRRQLHGRRRAEALNARLRQLLRTQTDVAQELIHVLKQVELARQELHSDILLPVEPPLLSLSTASSDDEMERRLTRMSLEWRVPFESNQKFHKSTKMLEFSEAEVVRDNVFEFVVDIRDSKAFPFPRKRVEDEVWRYFHSFQCFEEGFLVDTQVAPVSHDTLAGGWQMKLRSTDLVGSLDSRVRNRRRRNEDGELIITTTICGRACPLNNRESETVEAIVFEDSWLRIIDVREEQSNTPMTVVQHVRRTRIQVCGESGSPSQSRIDSVKRLAAEMDQLEMRNGQETAERRLMLGPSNLIHGL